MNRILLIQDEEMNQDNLTRRLIRRGYAVDSLNEVEAGLKAARAQAYQLIIVDMNLADMDGWEAVRRFRQDEATTELPVIGICNDELEGAEAMAMDAGCIAFEERPVALERLLEKFNMALHSSGASPS